MLTSEQQKIYNVKVPKGGYGYYTLYHGIYDPENDIDERPAYAQTGDLFEPEGSSVVYKATRKNGKTTWAIDEDAQRQSESGESGSGGSSLPSMTGKNGKVLGVTLDAQEHEQIEWVTPSGGGAEKFVVTLTQENDGEHDIWVADKTCAQIYAAHQAGKECVVQLTYESEGFDVPVEAPLSYALGVENDGETVYLCMFSTPFVNETSKIAMLNIMGSTSADAEEEDWNFNRAIAENPIPSYSSSNNGKVLGVDDGYLAWVDSSAPLIVTMTEDQQNPGTYVGDKTFSEIKTAFEAGRNVVGILPVLNASVSVIQVAEDNSSIVISTGNKDIAFTGAANDYPSITP